VAISICVPVYNDWENASLLIENFVSCNYKEISLMVIDNGSHHPSESVNDRIIKAHRINRPLIDRLKTMIASVVQTIVAGTPMVDTGGTPSAIHRTSTLWDELARAPKDYMFDSYMLFAAKRLQIKVERPPVLYHQRLIGSSHWQSGFAAEASLMKSLVYSIIQWRLEGFRKGRGK
jgi:glycosyltransferase involved in cell wall biosynthesis